MTGMDWRTLVLPYLEHESEKVVRGALEAVGMLMGAEGEEIYWKYLLDTRPCISKAAYQCIREKRDTSRRSSALQGAGKMEEIR